MHQKIVLLIMLACFTMQVSAVTEAELEALEKQIEQQEAERKQQLQEAEEARRRAEKEQRKAEERRQAEAEAKKRAEEEERRLEEMRQAAELEQERLQAEQQRLDEERRIAEQARLEELERKRIEEEAREKVEREKMEKYVRIMNEAEQALAGKDYELAEEKYRQALVLYENDSDARERLSYLEGLSSVCDMAVGSWDWFHGGITNIHANGTIDGVWTIFSNTGTWECNDPAERKIILRWNVGGWIDYLVLSDDGRRLDGKNQHGTSVSGVKQVQ